MQQVKVLLVQIASNGDCLFVTAIAKQIKEVDFPGCHLTWLIGSRCAQVIKNNPFIDNILQIPLVKVEDIQNERDKIDEHIANLNESFDKIFITDLTPANQKNWFGTTRSALFRSYPNPLKISPQPLIYLTDDELLNVANFCTKNQIDNNSFNILFECAPQSGQSFMTFERARSIAHKLADQHPNIKFILTSNQSFVSNNPNIIDGSLISWRENAELANYCHLLVGCSSGVSWLCTANWTKQLPVIQVINPYYAGGMASMKMDFKFWGMDRTNLIELDNPTDSLLEDCIVAATNNNFELARKKYDTKRFGAFLNPRFTKEAHIPGYEKLWFWFYYLFLGPYFLSKYRAIKPAWFKPVDWIRKDDYWFEK